MNQDEKLPKPIYVYVLTDPRTGDVRYVGVTDNPKKRLQGHIRDVKREKTHKANWIKSLLRDGLNPIMTLIDETDNENWQQCEIGWIAHYRAMGCNLVNSTDGGDGVRNPSEETRKRMSESAKVKIFTNEHRRKIGDKSRGVPRSKETRRKISESKKGIPRDKKTVQKMAKNNPNKKAVLQYDSFGHFIKQWDSGRKASRELGIHQGHIGKCCQKKPKYKTVGGFIWRYADDPLLGEYPTQLKLDLE